MDGSSAPLFDDSICPIPYVPKIDFRFVDDCTVPPAPDPIFDCPDISIPLDTPIPPVPCPVVRIRSVESSIGYGELSLEFEAKVSTSRSCGKCFEDFDFVLNITVPEPNCPEVELNVNTNVEVTETEEPNADVTGDVIVTPSGDGCIFDFNFDFNFEFPSFELWSEIIYVEICNRINFNVITLTTTYPDMPPSADIDIIKTGCTFDFFLTVNIPPPSGVAPPWYYNSESSESEGGSNEGGSECLVNDDVTLDTVRTTTTPAFLIGMSSHGCLIKVPVGPCEEEDAEALAIHGGKTVVIPGWEKASFMDNASIPPGLKRALAGRNKAMRKRHPMFDSSLALDDEE